MRKRLRDNHGFISVEFLVGIFLALACIAFALAVLPIFAAKADLDSAADKLMRSAELSGHTNLDSQAQMLREETGLDFSVSWSGTDYISSGKVQLNSDIHLELIVDYPLQFYIFPSHTIPLHTRRVGTSEVYYK